LGQDNAEIAASVGFSAEQIADMQKDGVLYSA
jgi:formyl-CoA transferase